MAAKTGRAVVGRAALAATVATVAKTATAAEAMEWQQPRGARDCGKTGTAGGRVGEFIFLWSVSGVLEHGCITFISPSFSYGAIIAP